ncbi:MAG TPA: hypothetical protein P5149_11355 [Candidatus Competibacteraceae bacterium]|nr:hypothetical protein [Gammaproteobacteria bacterium]HRY18988.1 hypothetical protein [Candidatus Competibacteraceae bacterium]
MSCDSGFHYIDAMDAGLGDYQIRGWRCGWHHHMTLVMMTMLFLLEAR